MTHMYFSARTEGRISYGHLGRTNSCYFGLDLVSSGLELWSCHFGLGLGLKEFGLVYTSLLITFSTFFDIYYLKKTRGHVFHLLISTL